MACFASEAASIRSRKNFPGIGWLRSLSSALEVFVPSFYSYLAERRANRLRFSVTADADVLSSQNPQTRARQTHVVASRGAGFYLRTEGGVQGGIRGGVSGQSRRDYFGQKALENLGKPDTGSKPRNQIVDGRISVVTGIPRNSRLTWGELPLGAYSRDAQEGNTA